MVEDLIALALLAGLGWWFFPEELRRAAGGQKRVASGLVGHPYYRLGVALVLLLSLGWLHLFMAMGSHNLKRLLQGKAAGDPTCYHTQQVTFYSLEAESATTMKPQPCPRGGTIKIDEEGYITCELHGRNPKVEKLKK